MIGVGVEHGVPVSGLAPLAVMRQSKSGQSFWARLEGEVDGESTTTWLQIWKVGGTESEYKLAVGIGEEKPVPVATLWARQRGKKRVLEGRWGFLKLLLFPADADGMYRLYHCVKE